MIEEMNINSNEIDFISVTSHPGLPGSLVVWVTTAHMLGALRSKEVVEVNHIMGHVFSVLLDRSLQDIQLPYVCLTVSWGHNDIYIVEEEAMVRAKDLSPQQPKRNHLTIGQPHVVWPYTVTKIAQTLDDAAWEVYDKVSRMLWWPYPWGYRLDCQAKEWWPDPRVDLRINTLWDKPLQFSFSGIKSQVYNLLRKFEREWVEVDDKLIKNIAWKFQHVVSKSLTKHAIHACDRYGAKTLGVVGWVSANSELRKKINQAKQDWLIDAEVLIPISLKYCTDNGAMIGVVGHLLK
jgi:N6-L-threonylcarbamoyladenine synthase